MSSNLSHYFLITGFTLICVFQSSGQTQPYVTHKYETSGRIHSHPTSDGDFVYFGSNDNQLVALRAPGKEKAWSYETDAPVQSTPLVDGKNIYFSSGNKIYALHKDSGEEIWNFTMTSNEKIGAFDPWDYHHGSPVVFENQIYFGCPDGQLRCFDKRTGELLSAFPTVDSAAIRCSPAVMDQIIYFGDWKGRVYAYDTEKGDTLWTHRTYEKQLYPTFGQLNTKFVVSDSLLFFGARNPELQVLNRHTGKVVWNHVESDGGWISGDPLVYGDRIFIGGSDCHKLFAFHAHTGELFWAYEFLNNNFSQPLLYDEKYLIFTTGDAYSYLGTNTGRGYLYAINKIDGSIINMTLLGGNALTDPVLAGGQIFAGSDDHHMYAVNVAEFLADGKNLKRRGYLSFDFSALTPNPYIFKDSIDLSLQVKYPSDLDITISTFPGKIVRTYQYASVKEGEFSFHWDGTDTDRNTIPAGYYILEVKSGEYSKSTFLQKE